MTIKVYVDTYMIQHVIQDNLNLLLHYSLAYFFENGLFYICEYFGITPAEFFDINTHNPVKLQELVKSASGLNSEQLEHLISIIKDLKRY